MPGRCCRGGGRRRRLARRCVAAGVSMLPGAVLVLLPKCPLCIAAWLTVVTGIGVPVAAAGHVRGLIVVCWISVASLAAAQIIRRRAGEH